MSSRAACRVLPGRDRSGQCDRAPGVAPHSCVRHIDRTDRPWSNAGLRGPAPTAASPRRRGRYPRATLIGLEAVPVDVALMRARHHELPVRLATLTTLVPPSGRWRVRVRPYANAPRSADCAEPAGCANAAVAPTRVRPCLTGKQATREHEALLPEEADCLDSTSVRSNVSKTSVARAAPACRDQGRVFPRPRKPSRPAPHLKLAALGLVELTTTHARLED